MTVKNVWVISDQPHLLSELLSGARQVGSSVSSVVLASDAESEGIAKKLSDTVYRLTGGSSETIIETCTPAMCKLIADEKPDLILIGNTKRGRLIAGKLAAKLGVSALTDVMKLATDSGVCGERMVYGGAGIRSEKSKTGTALALTGPGVLEPQAGATGQGAVKDIPLADNDTRIKLLKRSAKESKSVDLKAAKRVIGVGRGMAHQEDLAMIEKLAKLIGAEIACSRPIAEGENWLPRERYLGVSGVMIKPDLYIAIGISGQVQHMVGCNQSKVFVAINKDKGAPIFSQTDLGIVGDLYQIVPAMIGMLESGKA